jgi:hypothetical protein
MQGTTVEVKARQPLSSLGYSRENRDARSHYHVNYNDPASMTQIRPIPKSQAAPVKKSFSKGTGRDTDPISITKSASPLSPHTMSPSLDHIIILVPYAYLVNPPSWLADNFTITPGGRHGDGKTENKLICFRDGSYIELIAFINDDPKNRQGHWWDKEFGIVDFSFAYSDSDPIVHYAELEERLKKLNWGTKAIEVGYETGARMRPDGQEIKWQVTFPVVTSGYQRGEVPFFTHDITPRPLRVPFSEESVTHPSSAVGVKSLSNFIQASKISTLTKAYSAILGIPSLAAEEHTHSGVFEVQGANEVDGGQKAKIYLHAPIEESQLEQMKRRGGSMLGDLVLGVSVSDGTKYPQRIDLTDGGIGGVFLDLY